MDQNLNVYQAHKKSLTAVILMIISASCLFFNAFISFAMSWPVTFRDVMFFLLTIAPMILLIVYMLACQDKGKGTALVPTAFIVLTIELSITTILIFTKVNTYSPDFYGISTLATAILCYIPMIVFSSLLIADGYNGFKKKGFVVALSVFAFISCLVKFAYASIVYTEYEIFSTLYIMSLFEIVSYVLFYVSLIVFSRNGNIPTIIKRPISENCAVAGDVAFCPVCGEKFADGAMFCPKCGTKR